MQTISRNLDKVQRGEEEDLRIVENDLIIVPPNRAKIFFTILLSAVGYTSRGASYSFGSAGPGAWGGAAWAVPAAMTVVLLLRV